MQSAPAIGTDGTIYAGSWAGKLYAVNPDGSLRWSRSLTSNLQPVSAAALGQDGTIYVGVGPYPYLAALNLDGSNEWAVSLGGNAPTPTIADDGTIYAAGDRLYATTPQGVQKWFFPIDGVWGAPAVDSGGTAYIASTSSIYAINPNKPLA